MFRERPYRILNPPAAPGKAKIGRPPTTSSINMNSFASSPSEDEVFIIASHPQPSRPSFSTIFRTLVDLPSSPSFTTRSVPPLTLFVSILIRFRLTVTSTGSVSTPFGSTVRRIIASLSTLSGFRYWKRAIDRSYKRSSSTNLIASCSEA